MSTDTKAIGIAPAEVTADENAVLEHILSRKPLDPSLYRRIREQAESVTEDIRREKGLLASAVDLVREARDEG